MTIKLVALDLDGTTLDRESRLSRENRDALNRAMDMGVHIVIATGRCLDALPKEVRDFDGIRYAVTSNGAHIYDLREKKTVYRNCIDPSTVEEAMEILGDSEYMVEVFVDGRAYMEKRCYENVISSTSKVSRTRDYVLATRNPIEGLKAFALAHGHEVENINIFFEDEPSRQAMKPVLERIKNATITTSLKNNLEIGGKTTGKGKAILALCEILGIKKEEILACGDSPNDNDMLLIAGIPVAVANAEDSVKENAVYIAPENYRSGVAKAVEKFVLDV